jgi:hypothetical protein
MQAYYNINNLVEIVRRCVNLSAPAYHPLSFNCAHLNIHMLFFAKDENLINLGVNPLEKITLLTICFPAAA